MRVGLQGRLFVSHLVVMLVGLGSFIAISKAAAHHLFAGHLDHMATMGRAVDVLRNELLEGFETAWSSSTKWSLLVGSLTAAGLSYWVARRITQPLAQMETHRPPVCGGELGRAGAPQRYS